MATTIDRTTEALPQPVGPEGLSEWSRALREDVLADGNSFDERAIIMAESFRATEGEPKRQIRVAKAVAHLFEQMPVRIREGGEVLAPGDGETMIQNIDGRDLTAFELRCMIPPRPCVQAVG